VYEDSIRVLSAPVPCLRPVISTVAKFLRLTRSLRSTQAPTKWVSLYFIRIYVGPVIIN